MKIFVTCLLASLIFCQTSFASPKDVENAKKAAEDSQQKMAQLQQILMRAAQSSTGTTTSGTDLPLASTSASVSAPVDKSANFVLPVANVVSSPKSTVYDDAFSGVVNQMLPMSPEQIAKLQTVFKDSQSAAATPPGIPPKPTSTSIVVNLSPQATPPVIRLGAGYITSLVFVDTTGQPWPIQAYSIGDPSAFNIQWDRKGNTLLIQSSTFYKRSNLAVMLRDLNTPIMITLIPGQGAVDYRVDLHVPGIGPNAVFAQTGMPEVANPMLLDVLSGIPPMGSKELKVRGGNGQAWSVGNKLYLRTTNNLNVISPAWQATMRSADGTNAYQLPPSPVVLATQNGMDKVITLRLEGN